MNAQYPKLKSPCGEQSIQMCLHWFPKNEMIEFLSQEKEERKDFEKQASLGSPKEPRNIMRGGGGLGGHLYLRGPGCVVLMFYAEQKKANCPFLIVRKGKVVFILTLRGVYKRRSQPGTELKWLYLLCVREKQSKRNHREKGTAQQQRARVKAVSPWLGVFMCLQLTSHGWVNGCWYHREVSPLQAGVSIDNKPCHYLATIPNQLLGTHFER